MIRLQGVGKTYHVGSREIAALREVNLEIARGEVFGIIGHSGAGKSTLIRLLNRLEKATTGRIELDGEDLTAMDDTQLRSLRLRVGMIFQHFNLLGSRTVAQNVAIPLRVAGVRDAAAITRRVAELLDLVGLADQGDKYPSQLSGGQKQRVGIARALANDPKVLLCDEATSALDPQTTRSVLDLLLRINEQLGLTIVLITHEMDVVRAICDHVAVLDDGVIVEQGPVSQVFLHPAHPTTRHFVQEAEDLDEGEEREDFARVDGCVVRLSYLGEHVYAPMLAEVARDQGVDFCILSGRVERIKRTPCGQLTLALSGSDASIRGALAQLSGGGVHVDVLRAAPGTQGVN
ncbi:MAG: methionine ABC transporter ATP-binding protein [Candidatus Dactylopiibacterium sp.]|nr:methionine ABC transporter ATP-binding protein [Candidatus Dactylopiibacterium sp.]